MEKVYVTMLFGVEVPEGMTLNEWKRNITNWTKEDAAGFLLSRPTLEERLPIEVKISEHVPGLRGGVMHHGNTGVQIGDNCTQTNQF